MKRLRYPYVLCAKVAALALFLADPQPAAAIVGGELDGNGHPNVGVFVLINTTDLGTKGLDLNGDGEPDDLDGDGVPDSLPFACGTGTMIHDRVFLMAGHGTILLEEDLANELYTLDDVRVSFGADALDPNSWLRVSDVFTHPDFDPNTNTGFGGTPVADAGVLILERPAKRITPALLAPCGFLDVLDDAGALLPGPDGTKFTVVGYGWHGDAPNEIYPVDGLRRTAESEFMLFTDRWLYLDQNPAHGNGGTANCDSGGPTFWVDPVTGQEVLVALTSRGDGALVATGIAYRTDTLEALDFIDAVIELVESGAI